MALLYLSLLPFLVFILLLIFLRRELLFSSFSILLLLAIELFFVWKIFPSVFLSSTVKGFTIALDILVIVTGAIFFLETLRSRGIIDRVVFRLSSFFADYRVQIIVLAWFFENFLEGTAGFGVPAAIVAPLLIGLGLAPLQAVIVALLGNSTSVVFGAVGTPISLGFASVADPKIPVYAALFNYVGILVPSFILFASVSHLPHRFQLFREALPFALWSGFAFTAPSFFSVFLGQEFPSIVGSVVGLGLVIFSTHFGLFLPPINRSLIPRSSGHIKSSCFPDFSPYLLLILLLIIGKITFPRLNPGYIFIIAALPFTVFRNLPKSLFSAIKRAIPAFLVVAIMSSFTQLLTNSGQNSSGLPSIILSLSSVLHPSSLAFLAPFIGTFGSFITGSATVSNLMFGGLLHSAAASFSQNPAIILGLEVSGAAAGNMIALADILAAETIAGLKNQERQVVAGVIVPCLIYLLLLGLIGLLY